MPEVATFKIVRSPQLTKLADREQLALAGPLLSRLSSGTQVVLAKNVPAANDPFATFEQDHGDFREKAAAGAVPHSAIDAALAAAGTIDRWLAAQRDRPDPRAFSDFLSKTGRDLSTTERPDTLAAALPRALAELSDWIFYLLSKGEIEAAQEATRLALVVGLAQIALDITVKLSTDDIWAYLHRRVPVLPARLPLNFAKSKIALVRNAVVSDLYVVRSEWRAYLPGEVASIRNIMAGESFHDEQKTIREQETTATQETSKTDTEQKTTEIQDQSELTQQINTQIQAHINGSLQFDSQTGFPGDQYEISGGVDAGVSVDHSEAQASRIARQSVDRATATVESTTRQSRTQRELQRSEDTTVYEIKDSTDSNRAGIYRWVDRIDRYQLFRYPGRLQLEFELPEPAAYVRWRQRQNDASAKTAAPPAWDIKLEDITEEKAIDLATKYRAANLPAPPEKSLSLIRTLTGTATMPADMKTAQWKAPTVLAELDLPLPDGYKATSVSYSGWAQVALGNWEREGETHDGFGELEAFHSMTVSVGVGSETYSLNKGGKNTVQKTTTQFSDACIYFNHTTNLATPAATQIKVGMQVVGAASAIATFAVECTRSDENYAHWRYSVYDALFAAWDQWNKDWQGAQERSAMVAALPAGESSATRNAQTVHDELKRQVVSWLFDESPFNGRAALQLQDVAAQSWPDIDLAKARSTAATIQFFEQAFEWPNMQYILYPYFWAARGHWDELVNLQATDPDFERFLKSGSARVVLSVRPGFEQAVYYWLLYQQPFMGKALPVPDEPTYVSIAKEIQDLTQAPGDGIAGDCWETKLGTTLVWLDDSNRLPTNANGRLGAPPHQPQNPLTP